ncbi:MAG TPA: 3-hydroxyacyl-CoA dehydrogenase NAD-binding domain-containing protein, partial [Bacillales bacterium]|nr:3-hydroxyacyl-CoA dehydrogenase NAD-binding domain-containing protein [Bacillales bacterium]
SMLLDIVPGELTDGEKAKGLTLEDAQVRNRLGNQALKKLLKLKPAPLTAKENLDLIEVGNLEDDLERLSEADWIIEVVVEKLDIKQKVLAQVEQHRKEGSIVSSNTSGISIEAMAEGRSKEFRKHFLGTHFFNPPRYLKLLEVIPTPDTGRGIVDFMKKFSEDVLGKGVVEAKDTPNFIGNRIGIYGLLVTVREMMARGFSIGEVDSVTGPLIGRPKSATFRTLDVVGLDTFVHVANNIREKVDGEERDVFAIPDFLNQIYEKGWIGSKAGQGLYLKKKGKDGKSEILQLNPKTLDYEPREKLKTKATEMAKQAKTLPDKLKTLAYSEDRAGELIWNIMKPTLLYTAEKAYEIADDIVGVDQAMKWGFGWETGPFETWDAIGLEKSVERMRAEGERIPKWIEDMLAAGHSSFYKEGKDETKFYHDGTYETLRENPKNINLSRLKKQDRV